MTPEFLDAVDYLSHHLQRDLPEAGRLEFYGLYKQAAYGTSLLSLCMNKTTNPQCTGDCNLLDSLPDSSPTVLAKYKAWMSKRGMTPEDAMKKYVRLVDEVDAHWREVFPSASSSSPSSKKKATPVVFMPNPDKTPSKTAKRRKKLSTREFQVEPHVKKVSRSWLG